MFLVSCQVPTRDIRRQAHEVGSERIGPLLPDARTTRLPGRLGLDTEGDVDRRGEESQRTVPALAHSSHPPGLLHPLIALASSSVVKADFTSSGFPRRRSPVPPLMLPPELNDPGPANEQDDDDADEDDDEHGDTSSFNIVSSTTCTRSWCSPGPS